MIKLKNATIEIQHATTAQQRLITQLLGYGRVRMEGCDVIATQRVDPVAVHDPTEEQKVVLELSKIPGISREMIAEWLSLATKDPDLLARKIGSYAHHHRMSATTCSTLAAISRGTEFGQRALESYLRMKEFSHHCEVITVLMNPMMDRMCELYGVSRKRGMEGGSFEARDEEQLNAAFKCIVAIGLKANRRVETRDVTAYTPSRWWIEPQDVVKNIREFISSSMKPGELTKVTPGTDDIDIHIKRKQATAEDVDLILASMKSAGVSTFIEALQKKRFLSIGDGHRLFGSGKKVGGILGAITRWADYYGYRIPYRSVTGVGWVWDVEGEEGEVPAALPMPVTHDEVVERLKPRSLEFYNLIKLEGTVTVDEATEVLKCGRSSIGGFAGAVTRAFEREGLRAPISKVILDRGVRAFRWVGNG